MKLKPHRRVLDPGFWSDPKLLRMPRDFRTVLAALITFADDQGVLHADVDEFHAAAFQADPDMPVGAAIQRLISDGILATFPGWGRVWWWVTHFHRYQALQYVTRECPFPPLELVVNRLGKDEAAGYFKLLEAKRRKPKDPAKAPPPNLLAPWLDIPIPVVDLAEVFPENSITRDDASSRSYSQHHVRTNSLLEHEHEHELEHEHDHTPNPSQEDRCVSPPSEIGKPIDEDSRQGRRIPWSGEAQDFLRHLLSSAEQRILNRWRDVEGFAEDWVPKAFAIVLEMENPTRSLKYVEPILHRWKASGGPPARKVTSDSSRASPPAPRRKEFDLVGSRYDPESPNFMS